MNFWSCEYLRALFTKFNNERAMASRSTRSGGTSSAIFSSKANPFCSIWKR